MSTWLRKHRGGYYSIGVEPRQIRVGKPKEQVAVIRLAEDMKKGDELIMTKRDVSFAAIFMGFLVR